VPVEMGRLGLDAAVQADRAQASRQDQRADTAIISAGDRSGIRSFVPDVMASGE